MDERTRINGGFFWVQDAGGILISGGGVVFTNNVICGRPRWWQLRRWYRAIKLWLALPHTPGLPRKSPPGGPTNDEVRAAIRIRASEGVRRYEGQ